jgi:hypothetical protein
MIVPQSITQKIAIFRIPTEQHRIAFLETELLVEPALNPADDGIFLG